MSASRPALMRATMSRDCFAEISSCRTCSPPDQTARQSLNSKVSARLHWSMLASLMLFARDLPGMTCPFFDSVDWKSIVTTIDRGWAGNCHDRSARGIKVPNVTNTLIDSVDRGFRNDTGLSSRRIYALLVLDDVAAFASLWFVPLIKHIYACTQGQTWCHMPAMFFGLLPDLPERHPGENSKLV